MPSATLLVAFVLAFPDPPPERYEPIPVRGNIAEVLKNLLQSADEEDGFQRLVKQIRDQAQLGKVPPEWLEQLDAQNPWVRGNLRDLALKMNAGEHLTLQDLEMLKRRLEGWQALLKQNGGAIPFQPGAWPPALPPPPREVAPPAEDRLNRWTRDLLKEIDQTEVGDFLRDSPAWQRALAQLENNFRLPQGNWAWLGKLPKGWGLPEGLTRPLGNLSLGRLPEVSLPEIALPNWGFSAPRFGGWGGPPRFGGGPGLGGGGSMSDGVFWGLALLLLVVLSFFFYRQLGRTPAAATSTKRLGPWPVNPASISTRRELILAFEYLARLRLGEEVLSWNHRAVATRLGAAGAAGAASAAVPATELAGLYEVARYTTGDEPLSPDQQAAARRTLAALSAC